LDNNATIKTLTLYGNSLKKLYKYLPGDCIKATPYSKTGTPENNLEVNIGGVVLTGKDDNSSIVINSSDRTYTEEELVALQKMASKCYTYPFGDIGFVLKLNIYSNDKNVGALKDLIDKCNIEHSLIGTDSENLIELNISDVKDYSKPAFISFILELQAITHQ